MESSDQRHETARQLGVSVEQLERMTEEEVERRRLFKDAANYVLEKNAELYRRLAR